MIERSSEFEEVTLRIDGRLVPAVAGERLVVAAAREGFRIPAICHHPDLEPTNSCGLCLVAVRGSEELQSACTLQASAGLEIRTKTPEIIARRQARVAELYRDHPNDCPVCDMNGDCDLQRLYLNHEAPKTVTPIVSALARSSAAPMSPVLQESPAHVSSPARKVGNELIFHEARCVGCRLCSQFVTEVAGGEALPFNADSGRLEIAGDASLAEGYSLNTADLCPSGALLNARLSGRAPAWGLAERETICPGCATGCNATLTYDLGVGRGRRTPPQSIRLRPRRNPEVNGSWMCDAGRTEYRRVDQDRLDQPVSGGIEVGWSGAFVTVGQALTPFRAEPEKAAAASSGVGALIGYDATCEEIWLLRRLMRELLGQSRVALLPCRPDGEADDFLVDADKHPNRLGALLMVGEHAAPDGLAYLQGLDAVVVLGADPLAEMHGDEFRRAYLSIKHRIVIAAHRSESTENATIILPATSFAEKTGTWVNRQSRAQLLTPTTDRGDESRDPLAILREIAMSLGAGWAEEDAAQIFDRIAEEHFRFEGLSHAALGSSGRSLVHPRREGRA